MIAFERFEKPLAAPEPGKALRSAIRQLAVEGHAKTEIHESLEQFLLHLREDRRGADEDLVLDTLDALSGWCHAEGELLPER